MIGTILAPWHMVYRNSTNSYRAVKLRVMIGWDKREIEKWKGTSTLLILWVRLVTEISLWRNTWSRNVPGANKGVSWKSRHIEKNEAQSEGSIRSEAKLVKEKEKYYAKKSEKRRPRILRNLSRTRWCITKKRKYKRRCERANTKDAVSVRIQKTLWACECERRYESANARDAMSIEMKWKRYERARDAMSIEMKWKRYERERETND